ncbi:MAG: hypothetical protein JXQ68_08005 [Campylobacterales bacterium]|nr:hypothetical protein [Campylobacterales bacterium]
MKAYIAKNKWREEKNYLVIAATKKEALAFFASYIGGFGFNYLKKDFNEVKIKQMDLGSISIFPPNLESYGLSECFTFNLQVKTDPYIYYEEQLISDDEATTKGLIKLFKNEYADFFKKYL